MNMSMYRKVKRRPAGGRARWKAADSKAYPRKVQARKPEIDGDGIDSGIYICAMSFSGCCEMRDGCSWRGRRCGKVRVS